MRTPGFAGLYGATHGASLDQVVGALICARAPYGLGFRRWSAAQSLFPGGFLPPAEMEYKGLKQEYNLAWDAYNKGNKGAISQFFDDHPESALRLKAYWLPEGGVTQKSGWFSF